MCKQSIYIFVVAVLLAVSVPADGRNLRGGFGVPVICTDVSSLENAKESEYVPCSTESGKTGPTAVAGSNVVVFSSRKILNDVNWCFYWMNEGGGGGSALTDIDVQVSPDGTNWHSLTFTDCDTIGSGVMCTYCVDGNAYAYVRSRATGTNTTVSAWYTSNRG